MKKWEVVNKFRAQNSEFRVSDLLQMLLANRGIKMKKEIEAFLHPALESVTIDTVGIDKKQLSITLRRIKKAIANKEQILVFGDYDVDGICGAAILWETLNKIGARVMPYIPHRVDEGYGLSIKGIENVTQQIENIQLIITVDNGIVANEAVLFARKKGIDVIITDHHVASKKLPDAHAIVHTTKLCGTGVAYMLAKELAKKLPVKNGEEHLELVALATIADLVSLTGANRALTKFGLEKLRVTKRLGLLELFQEAALDPLTIDVYQVGHMIAPRLNAMGRLEYAMESLRLLCTHNKEKARMLAMKLGTTNRERQQLTLETVSHAKTITSDKKYERRKLLFIADESYQQGIIGLVAGKLVEEYYRPSIVVSIGETYSKASARSVQGFNIIEFIRSASELLVDAGGHPMAAGFTVETTKLTALQQRLEALAHKKLNKKMLTRVIRIDCELPLSYITFDLYKAIQSLSPFGMGNPEPVFMAKQVILQDMRLIGAEKKHIKLKLRQAISNKQSVCFDAIGFGLGGRSNEFHIDDAIAIVYTIDENKWNGNTSLQLKIKDIQKSNKASKQN